MNPLDARRRLLGRNVYKKTVEGNPAIAQGSLARRYPGITMQGWTEQNGTPTPEAPVPIVSAGTQNQETGKWEYEIEVGCGQLAEDSVVSHPDGEYVPDKIIFSGNITGEYTISLEEVGEVSYTHPNAGIIRITINGKNEIISRYQLPYTFSGNITDITVFSSSSYTKFTGTIKFMLNPGSTPLPYTPYRPPQTVTLTSDRPLTKWDRLEKRNGQWGWVYKSAEVVLDGSVDEAWRYQTDANRKIQFYIALPDALYPYSDPFKEMFYCDTFLTTNNLGAIPKWQVRKGAYNGLAPVFKPSDDIDTVEAFRNFLAENQTTILYVTKEETFIPLSESEQEQMNALHTYYPTTVLSNDCGCNMTLTYKTKKSLEAAT